MKKYYGFIVEKYKAGVDKAPEEMETSDSFSDIVSVSSARPQSQNTVQLEKLVKN